MIRDRISDLFVSPGEALLHNPFGNRPQYFFGLFYVLNPSEDLIDSQVAILKLCQHNDKNGQLFRGDRINNTDFIENCIFDITNDVIDSSDQLCDINIWFPQTGSGICITQEESLFLCSSLDIDIAKQMHSLQLRYKDAILRSTLDIKKHVRFIQNFGFQ